MNSRDLKKHRKDVFRLAQIIDPKERIELPEPICSDMKRFLELAQKEGVPLSQMHIDATLDEMISLLRTVYGL